MPQLTRTPMRLLDKERTIAAPGFNRWLVPPDQAYNVTMYVLAAMLLGGLLCNLLIRPVRDHHHMSGEQLAAERGKTHEQAAAGRSDFVQVAASSPTLLIAAWTAIALPLAWGVWITVSKSLALFR